MLNEFIAVTKINLSSLRYRLGSSQMIIFGVGGVVAVLVTLLIVSKGLETTLNGIEHPDRVVIVRAGAASEINGAISPEQAQIIRFLPGIKQQDGSAYLATESYASINLEAASGEYRSTPLRGIVAESFLVRPEIKIVSGRVPSSGAAEVLIGRGVARELPSLVPGAEIKIKNLSFTVVGVFESGGSFFESELWTGVEVVNDLFSRGGQFSSLTLQLETPAAMTNLKQQIAQDPRLTVSVNSEKSFYGSQAELTRQLISSMIWLLGIVMSIGAVFSVINTMYMATSSRIREVATLRALGFGRLSVVGSVITEGLLLATIGAVLAITVLALGMNGRTISTMGSNTVLSIELSLDAHSVLLGVTVAVSLGLLGALVPAVKSAHAPIVEGLRQA